MKMYIANLTRQDQDFIYKLPEGQQRMQQIPVGRQIVLAGDLNQKDIDAIVVHHARYGMKPVADAVKAKSFTGLCYSIDEPVKLEKMQIGIERNDIVLQERGVQNRKEAAVAINEALSKNDGPQLKSLQTEVVEEKRDGTDGVNETVVVSKDAPEEEQMLTGREATAAKAANNRRK